MSASVPPPGVRGGNSSSRDAVRRHVRPWFVVASTAPIAAAAALTAPLLLPAFADLDGSRAVHAEDAETWCNVSAAEIRSGDFNAAESAARRSLALDPSLAPAWFNLGRVHEERRELSPAISAFEESVQLDGRYEPTWYHLGRVLEESGHADRALAVVREGRASFPESADLWTVEGSVRLRRSETREALRCFDAAVARGPEVWYAHFGRGVCNDLLGRPDLAVIDLERSLELRPGRVPTLVRLADALLRTGRQERAVETLVAARAIDAAGLERTLADGAPARRERLSALLATR